jgi:tellurite resistance protein
MGLFDDVFSGGGSSKGKSFGKAESFAAILLGAAASDGHIAEEEAQGLWTITGRMQLFSNWTADRFNNMMDKLIHVLKRDGLDTLLERAAEGLPEELRETAFANACDLVLADGVVEDEEKKFLSQLTRVLGISGDQALTIARVMVVKNKG